MSSPSTSGQSARTPAAEQAPVVGWHVWLSRAALLIAVALVLCRLTISEQLRSTSSMQTRGDAAAPLGPGPTTVLLLDLLAWTPALLMLARRVLDGSFRLHGRWVAAPALLLGGWAVASTLWSSDRFAALVGSFTFLSAMALMWAAIQCVGSWFRFRLIAGVCLGMLLVLTFVGYWYRTVEWSDLKSQWEQSRDQVLAEHQWKPGSFEATQFEKRIFSGEIMGFSTSPNTHAALLVLLATIAAGIAIQRGADGGGWGWTTSIFVLVALMLPTLAWTGCRAAAVTSLLAAVLLSVRWVAGDFIAQHACGIFVRGCIAIVCGAVLVVCLGLTRHTLLQDSLTFRWWYWVAAARLMARHPLLGVGWDNFGPCYLAVRLGIASEEVRDPHNFLVRIATELGGIGLLLLLAWMGRWWWDVTTRPIAPSASRVSSVRWTSGKALGLVIAVAGVATVVGAVAGIDFVTSPAYAELEAIRRLGFGLLLVIGIVLGAMQVRLMTGSDSSSSRSEVSLMPDERPAPWILFAIVVALGLFLIHSLIDFGFFETGPMYLFALLSGAALSLRESDQMGTSADFNMRLPRVALVGAGLLWILAAVFVVTPIARAEQHTRDAEDAIRDGEPRAAADDLARAAQTVSYNSDYALRAAGALSGASPRDAMAWLDRAVVDDPTSVTALLTRARFSLEQSPPATAAALADYKRSLELDPNNSRLRLAYADLLMGARELVEARRQIDRALSDDLALSPYERKHLPASEWCRYRRIAQQLR